MFFETKAFKSYHNNFSPFLVIYLFFNLCGRARQRNNSGVGKHINYPYCSILFMNRERGWWFLKPMNHVLHKSPPTRIVTFITH